MDGVVLHDRHITLLDLIPGFVEVTSVLGKLRRTV
jgi:hypothetical protein